MDPNQSKLLLFVAMMVWASLHCPAQTMTLEGRLVEHAGSGKRNPVKGVKVSVFPYGQDVTRSDGSFAIEIPQDRTHITIEVGAENFEILSPNAGMVVLPPFLNMVEVLVASEETLPTVSQKVKEVNSKVKRLEGERRLNQRQILRLHKLMIDTVLYYETEVFLYKNQIQRLEQTLSASTTANQIKSDSIALLNQRLTHMRSKINSLSDQLLVALEEKYLRQQNHLEEVTSALQDYLDRTHDLNDRLYQINSYFKHPEAQRQIISAIEQYNSAWKKISVSYDGHITAVRHYWEDQYLSEELEDTYDFILKDIHDAVLHRPFNNTVLRPLQDWASRAMGLSAARKRANEGAKLTQEKLNKLIPELETKINQLRLRLKNSI